MKGKIFNVVIISVFTATLSLLNRAPLAAEMAPHPVMSGNTSAQTQEAMRNFLESYLRRLDDQEARMLRGNDLEAARLVRQEKVQVAGELARLSPLDERTESPIQPTPPQSMPARKVDINHTPTTYSSEVKGLAGAPSFTENNVYSFVLPQVGDSSILSYYATGRRSTESYGNVWLITPDGRREKISKWKSGQFDDPATEIKTYKKLAPLTEDISKYVREPGMYKVEFEWTDGIDPLVIFRVELTS